MRTQIKPVLAAFLTLSVLYLVGVMFFYGPIAAKESPGEPPVPQLLAFLISIVLYITLFVWLSRETGKPMKAAFAIALAQMLLVDVDYVLSGKRDITTAAASAILLLVSWGLTGWVYGKLDRSESAGDQPG